MIIFIYIMRIDLIYKELGNRLRRARKSAALTQQALADRIGLSRTSVTNIESGRQHVSLHMLFALANAVGVSPSDLLPEKESVAPPGILDQTISRKVSLEEDGWQWLGRVIAAGKSREMNNE